MAIFLKANWENIIMANYEIDPKILIPFIPQGVELDLFNGKAYISLVGFMFKKTKLFNIPIPYLGTFEEINLRFYVIRKEGNKIKRGVVFINETIPYPIVAWMANKLYKEHYTVVPTKHEISNDDNIKKANFEWLLNKKWNRIYVEASTETKEMKNDTLEQFIYEHYYGFTKIDAHKTEEYKLQHPSWKTNKVFNYKIDCDFKAMYGNSFSILNTTEPEAVFIAEGSSVKIEWKRTQLKLYK
ncbi:YqjF family protein [Flavobacterium sp.]|uniref:YqjF family protein n=1 Tax=Flavobacterium sp. TaxID=239 RepID=UPI0037523DFF